MSPDEVECSATAGSVNIDVKVSIVKQTLNEVDWRLRLATRARWRKRSIAGDTRPDSPNIAHL